MKSILASGADHTSTAVVPASFKDLASRFVDTLRESTDANEIRAFAANKVANPVLQAMIDLEAQQGKSDIPGSLIDSVLMGAISSLGTLSSQILYTCLPTDLMHSARRRTRAIRLRWNSPQRPDGLSSI
jgi:hypothetical protein